VTPIYLHSRRPQRPLDVRLRAALIRHCQWLYVAVLASVMVGLGMANDWSAAKAIGRFLAR
jgi:hypothetical protein